MKIILIVIFSIIFSGCLTNQVPILLEQLDKTQPCCQTQLSQLTFVKLPLEEKGHKFIVGPGDQVFQFPSGKSYVKSFELPENASLNDTLEVTTYLAGADYHAFGPSLLFLDSSYQLVGHEVSPQLFYRKERDRFLMLGDVWYGTVKIPHQAKYLVIFTKPELLTEQLTAPGTSGYAYMAGNVATYVPASGPRSIAYGPGGKLKLKLFPNAKENSINAIIYSTQNGVLTYELGDGKIKIPKDFKNSNAYSPTKDITTIKYTLPHDLSSSVSLQMSIWNSGKNLPQMSEEELKVNSEMYLLNSVEKTEQNYKSFHSQKVKFINIAGQPAAKIEWTGIKKTGWIIVDLVNKKKGEEIHGVSYCVIYNSRVYIFHTQDLSALNGKYTKLATHAIENIEFKK
jgi:Maltose operon periplasmic protein precursor (MalM)